MTFLQSPSERDLTGFKSQSGMVEGEELKKERKRNKIP